jgi:hypothetical protein
MMKGKARSFLRTPWSRMEECRHAPIIINLDITWMWVITFMPRPHYLKKKNLAHWIWGWVVPTADFDSLGKGKLSCTCRETNHGSSPRLTRSLLTITADIFRPGRGDELLKIKLAKIWKKKSVKIGTNPVPEISVLKFSAYDGKSL